MPPGITQSYGFGFTAASLRPELLRVVAEKFRETGSWEETRKQVLATNELQCRSPRSSRRLEIELRLRLQTLDDQQLTLIATADAQSRLLLSWLAAVKRSSFLYDFTAETLRTKLDHHDPVLRESDYRKFIDEKTSLHPELRSLKPSSTAKARQVVLTMLREACILSNGEGIGQLHRPVIPREVERAIRNDRPAWLAAFMVPEAEIPEPRPKR